MIKQAIFAVALFSSVATAALADVNSSSTSGSNAAAITSTSTTSQQGQLQGQNQGQGQLQSSTSGAASNQTQSTSSSASSNQSTTAQQGNAQNITYNNPSKVTETVKTTPGIVAPALTTTLTETCLGSVTGGVSFIGGGVTGGKTYVDQACVRRLNAREIAQTLNDRDAAKEVMCGDADVRKAYEIVGRPCGVKPEPVAAPAPVASTPTPAPTVAAPKPTASAPATPVAAADALVTKQIRE